MSWGNPWAAWFLLLIPAIILLYFLKLKRREIRVSSTLLWSRVLEDKRVNSPFQRFKKSLLLLIQILVMGFLALSLIAPEQLTESVPGRVHILLVDTSASMGTVEKRGTRLEIAKQLLEDYIESLASDERAVLIRFAKRAQAITPVTADRSVLKAALQKLQVLPTQTSFDEALTLAVSIAQTQDDAVGDAVGIVFSDGRFPQWEGGEVPLPVDYIRVGEESNNSGIVALASRMDFSDTAVLQVYAEVRNESSEMVTGFLSMYRDGIEIRAAEAEQIEAGAKWSQSFEADADGGLIELRWEPEAGDALSYDNRAWLEVKPRRKLRLWQVGDGNKFLSDALSPEVIPDLAVEEYSFDEAIERLQIDELNLPDLIIWDREAPAEQLPEGVNHLLLGVRPPGFWQSAEEKVMPPIVAWDRTHAVNRYVNYASLDARIEKAYVLGEEPASTPLLETTGGALIATFSVPGSRGICVSFDTLASTWPMELSWPFFIYNAINFLGRDDVGSGVGIRAQELLSVKLPAYVKECVLLRPDGQKVKLKVETGGWVRYSETDVLGSYKIMWQESEPGSGQLVELEHQVPVNLLSVAESKIAPIAELEIAGVKIEQSKARGVFRKELWPWVLSIALAMLMLEWHFYHRR